jgi:hypothetical protein
MKFNIKLRTIVLINASLSIKEYATPSTMKITLSIIYSLVQYLKSTSGKVNQKMVCDIRLTIITTSKFLNKCLRCSLKIREKIITPRPSKNSVIDRAMMWFLLMILVGKLYV